MRLIFLLTANEDTDKPVVNALLALMCFHASRFEARINQHGEPVLYEEQDTSLWDRELIARGAFHLNKAAKGDELSKYHLEAAIAYEYTNPADTPEKWRRILQLYNNLLQIAYSPVAALNRTYALSKAKSKAEATIEAEKLKLINNHLYYMLLGYLYTDVDNDKAIDHWNTALKLAKSETDKVTITKKINAIFR